MCVGSKEIEAFSWLKGWYFNALYIEKMPGGLLTTWCSGLLASFMFLLSLGIHVDILVKEIDRELKVLKTCGTYPNRRPSWEAFASLRALSGNNILLGIYINFTLCLREFYGTQRHQYPQGYFYSTFVGRTASCDLGLAKISPNWCNACRGGEHISKRLDHFLVSKPMSDCWRKHS